MLKFCTTETKENVRQFWNFYVMPASSSYNALFIATVASKYSSYHNPVEVDMNSSFSLAVHALVYLNHRQSTLSSEELASNICTNPATVRKTLAKLKAAGLVEAKEGAGGGYALSCDPDEVSLAQVAKALENVFVSVSWKSGYTDQVCLISSGMGSFVDDLCDTLDKVCYDYLANISLSDVSRSIFEK